MEEMNSNTGLSPLQRSQAAGHVSFGPFLCAKEKGGEKDGLVKSLSLAYESGSQSGSTSYDVDPDFDSDFEGMRVATSHKKSRRLLCLRLFQE
ncbi:MAG: hypothetical protein SWH61_05745 [Thermodesulfobacteriota bacterium]|nr:hypothetical protein [Thermodesulfobacteriota bacterium]